MWLHVASCDFKTKRDMESWSDCWRWLLWWATKLCRMTAAFSHRPWQSLGTTKVLCFAIVWISRHFCQRCRFWLLFATFVGLFFDRFFVFSMYVYIYICIYIYTRILYMLCICTCAQYLKKHLLFWHFFSLGIHAHGPRPNCDGCLKGGAHEALSFCHPSNGWRLSRKRADEANESILERSWPSHNRLMTISWPFASVPCSRVGGCEFVLKESTRKPDDPNVI